MQGEREVSTLTTKARKSIPKKEFGLPGEKKYPMPDKKHAANAKSRATQMVNAGKLSESSKAKIDAINPEESYFKKIVAGDSGDNILSVVKFTRETKGIGDTGSNTVYAMFKQKYPNEIDFDSNEFVENLCDILAIYRKNNDTDFKERVTERIKMSRTLTRLDGKYLPDGFQQILYENIKL